MPHASSKKSFRFVQFWAARSFCKRVLNSRICQHCDVKTSTVTPTFYYFFIIFFTCYISVPSFSYNLCQVLLLWNHLNSIVRCFHAFCPCQYFTIVFVLFFVAVAVSSHLCVICHHVNCLTLLLCGHVGFRNITLTGPHYSHLHVPFLEESNFCFRYQPFEP